MPTCISCTTPGINRLCSNCVNNWPAVRVVVQQHLEEKYGPATRDNLKLVMAERSRLENLWKRNKEHFVNEVNMWGNA